MARMTRSTYVPLPPETVFEFLLVPENAQQVMNGVVRFEQLDPGPVGLGTRFAQTRVVNGITATAQVSVVDFRPGRVLTLEGGAKGVQVAFRYRLTPAPGGTRIDLRCDVEGKGVLRMLGPILLQFVEREEGEHLERLAAAIGPLALPSASPAAHA